MPIHRTKTWWRHQWETFSMLLAICAGNSPVTGGFPSQNPVTRNFDVFLLYIYLRLNRRLNKQSRRRWFETLSRSLWRHWNVLRVNQFWVNNNHAMMTMMTIINMMIKIMMIIIMMLLLVVILMMIILNSRIAFRLTKVLCNFVPPLP